METEVGTQAGFIFACGKEYIQFDVVLEIIRHYKEQFEAEAEVELHTPSPFNPSMEPHFFHPHAQEIALLTEAMEKVEGARELTIKAITGDITGDVTGECDE